MRARELAEIEAKKHVEKLNEIMMKRQNKEKKMQEILEENSLERMARLEMAKEKRKQAKSKMER